ncbi:preprotein translocase subunit SecG [Aliarcobacter cibarius]|jgi:preprotein translocase subunit SecG|uniref:Protein-export membrane protein SecG n=1 Tax=Aliarcobacter cibarius TaxID=255507 RepID=A0A5J6RE34_9BACT|nr:preprotein translocase SecYEG, SecG subunit [Aliarcobacter cibarius]QKJ26052.1 preprotein translocase SecYEG, SecG subunit [Aliarcobacter cibarius]TLT00205.1 preprotein translocase subunit SecG [Aliarcobacter cibarius]TLT00616.1 preprotein translocase subunit SecG [Aliarcobacter cibarius]TLT05111.1 preprotein translocase subunit SecG [Aliarcobacter cibarius]
MTSTLLIVQFVLAVLIVIVVLLQKSSSMGLGAYSGSNESLFGAKGPANFLTKATMFLGLIFVLNTLFLGYTYNQERNKSAIDSVKQESLIPASPVTPAQSAPTAPVAPTTENKAPESK